MPASVFLITGVMAAGKSTVADRLARRFRRGVHVRGDSFRTMVVSGRVDPAPGGGAEADRQLEFRRRLATTVTDEYWRAGFDVVVQDILIGPALATFVDLISAAPLHVVVLTPRPDVVAEREATRPKSGYGRWTVEQLCAALEQETPRLGLWLDNSDQSPDQTVDEILARRADARVK